MKVFKLCKKVFKYLKNNNAQKSVTCECLPVLCGLVKISEKKKNNSNDNSTRTHIYGPNIRDWNSTLYWIQLVRLFNFDFLRTFFIFLRIK